MKISYSYPSLQKYLASGIDDDDLFNVLQCSETRMYICASGSLYSTFTTHPMNCISVTDLKENYMLVCLYICLCAFAFIGLSLWNRLPPLPHSLRQADGIPLQRHSQCEMSHTSQYRNIYLTLSVQQYTDSSQHMELVIVSLNVYKAPPQEKDNFAKRVAIMRM